MRYTLILLTMLGGLAVYGEAFELKLKTIERNTHIERMLE